VPQVSLLKPGKTQIRTVVEPKAEEQEAQPFQVAPLAFGGKSG
jgi:hypothetical protein